MKSNNGNWKDWKKWDDVPESAQIFFIVSGFIMIICLAFIVSVTFIPLVADFFEGFKITVERK